MALQPFLGSCPPLALSVTNSFPGGSTHLSAFFGCCRFWCGGRFSGAAGKPASEFRNLGIQLLFLGFHSQASSGSGRFRPLRGIARRVLKKATIESSSGPGRGFLALSGKLCIPARRLYTILYSETAKPANRAHVACRRINNLRVFNARHDFKSHLRQTASVALSFGLIERQVPFTGGDYSSRSRPQRFSRMRAASLEVSPWKDWIAAASISVRLASSHAM